MKKKILLLDDSSTARMLFRILLNEVDIELFDVGTWGEALDIAQKEDLALIIFDYNMPEKTGPEVAQMMLDEGVDVPFALMSANTQQHVLEEVQELGFIDVLEKPVTAEMVESLLEKL